MARENDRELDETAGTTRSRAEPPEKPRNARPGRLPGRGSTACSKPTSTFGCRWADSGPRRRTPGRVARMEWRWCAFGRTDDARTHGIHTLGRTAKAVQDRPTSSDGSRNDAAHVVRPDGAVTELRRYGVRLHAARLNATATPGRLRTTRPRRDGKPRSTESGIVAEEGGDRTMVEPARPDPVSGRAAAHPP
jgi:hypothetical protein